MLSPSILNYILFWFLKYILFYLIMMFVNKDSTFVSPGIRNIEDLTYYIIVFSGLPITMAVLLTLPIHFIFKSNTLLVYYGLIVFILFGEYVLYTLLASPSNYLNGLLNAVVTIGTFYLLFYKNINLKLQE